MGIACLIDGDPDMAVAWFIEGREAARGIGGLEAEALQGVARAMAMIGGDGVDRAFLDALITLRHDRNWMYAWVTLDALMTHWLAQERTREGAVLLGHLKSHVRANGVQAASRQRAVEVVGAHPRLAVFRQPGSTMSATELLEFAIEERAVRVRPNQRLGEAGAKNVPRVALLASPS
jgi:hypothetical protein